MRKIRFGILLFAAMIALLMVGCAPTEKDAENFVKEFLGYMSGERSDDEKINAEIEEALQAGINEELDEWNKLYTEQGGELSSESKERLAAVSVEAMKKIKYSVGSAKKTEDGFDVPVTIEPLLLYSKMEENLDHDFAEYLSGVTGELENTDFLDQFIESLVNSLEEAIQNPSYGEPVEFVVPLNVIDDQLEIKDEDNTAERLGYQLANNDIEYWTRENDPVYFKERADKVLNASISGEYDGSCSFFDNMIAFANHNFYENKLLYTQEEVKQEMIDEGEAADIAEEKASFYCAAQRMSKYECLGTTEKDGDPAVTVSVTVPDVDSFLNQLVSEISGSITEDDYRRFTSEEEFVAYYDKLLYEEANKRINEMKYKEPKEYALRFSKESDDDFYVPDANDTGDILVAITLND